jgi:hypothetical protein
VDELVGHPRARHVRRDRLPLLGRLADLLGELALGGLERRLALLVEAARGDLEEVRVVERLARLADEVEVRVVVTTMPAAPLWRTISRSTSSPSAKRNWSIASVTILPS